MQSHLGGSQDAPSHLHPESKQLHGFVFHFAHCHTAFWAWGRCHVSLSNGLCAGSIDRSTAPPGRAAPQAYGWEPVTSHRPDAGTQTRTWFELLWFPNGPRIRGRVSDMLDSRCGEMWTKFRTDIMQGDMYCWGNPDILIFTESFRESFFSKFVYVTNYWIKLCEFYSQVVAHSGIFKLITFFRWCLEKLPCIP